MCPLLSLRQVRVAPVESDRLGVAIGGGGAKSIAALVPKQGRPVKGRPSTEKGGEL